MAQTRRQKSHAQMKIGELARLTGVSASTLYEYLRSGLLPAPAKESPTKAYFTEDHVQRISRIRQLKEQGLSKAEILARFSPEGRSAAESSDAVDEIRLAIIDKALELFSTYHYENTRISDITQALNMGNGTFYRYFNSKEDLFLGCLDRLPKVLVPRDAWAEVEKETDYIQRLKKRGYAMLNAFPSYIGILNYAKLALGGPDKTLAAKAAECLANLVRPLMRDLKHAVAEGRVRDVDAEMVSYLLLGINETFGYLLLIDPRRSVEKGFAVIEDFITHALTPSPLPQTAKSVNAELTDRNGHRLSIDNLTWGADDAVTGSFLEGELRIPLSEMAHLTLCPTPTTLEADIRLRNGNQPLLTIDPNIAFSGLCPFGLFSIPGRNVRRIDFTGAV
ncbi:hypothetical protein JCM14469_35600 [Desulfatiferula olefinivorans]